MSSDFTTGKNKTIEKDDLIMMSCDVLASILNTSRESLYKFYTDNGVCKGNGQWGYFDRYNKDYEMNDYVGNKFDDMIILSSVIDHPEFLDKSIETAPARRDKIKELCKPIIDEGRCNNFSKKLNTMFPHLDTPNEITALDRRLGSIPCIEEVTSGVSDYEMFTPIITYTDSCGCNKVAPVPQYPLDYPKRKLNSKKGNDLEHKADGQEIKWEITDNENQIFVSDETKSLTMPELEVATLSTAYLTTFSLNVTYKED